MCGRYYIDIDDSEMRAITAGVERYGNTAAGEVFPTNVAPVVSPQGTITAMTWGFRFPDGKGTLINARSETAGEKPMFRRPMTMGRCLIPASWYFEWEKQKSKKVKFAIKPPGESSIYMAGISRTDHDTGLECFVILTKPAWAGIAFIHDRMPVILPRVSHDEWLFGKDPSGVIASAFDEMEYAAV